MPISDNTILEVSGLTAGYGQKVVLQNVNFTVNISESIAIIGPNGSGKSTLLKTIYGLIKPFKGEIIFQDNLSQKARNNRMLYLPQKDNIFLELTVKENLELFLQDIPKANKKETLDNVFEIFPELFPKNNICSRDLSAGEKQMVSLCRAFISTPDLLLLDEPSLGLSEDIRKLVFEKITLLHQEYKMTILMVEQQVNKTLEISTRALGMKLGRIVYNGESSILKDSNKDLETIFI